MSRYVRSVVFSLRVGFSSNDNRVAEIIEEMQYGAIRTLPMSIKNILLSLYVYSNGPEN